MSIHIIIDGYNLIRQSDGLSHIDRVDLQMGREALIEALVKYRRRKPHRITVVFDGGGAPPFTPQGERYGGIEIRFSRKGETADAMIKRMARREKERAMVVSSDREIVASAQRSGAAAIGSRAFERKLADGNAINDVDIDARCDEGWVPTTRKKGPSRRLSKRARKNHLKARKL